MAIEKGIPIPPATPSGRRMQQFRELEIGDSFLLRNHEASVWAARKACSRAKIRLGRNFTLRVLREGVRIWRVE